jgi:hypothetical protein
LGKLKKQFVYLQGGLGNQLFQYCHYLELSRQTTFNTYLDIGRVLHDGQHSSVSIVDLLSLPPHAYIETKNENLPILIKDSIISKLARFFMRTFGVRKLFNSAYDFDACTRKKDVPHTVEHQIGYFQYVDSIVQVKGEIEDNLNKNNKMLFEKYRKENANKVALHIRRGDFLNSKDSKHKAVELSYVKRALEHYGLKTVVFSDDLEWCKRSLQGNFEIEFFQGKSAIEDFLVLSTFKNYVLSGSTFSWWAAVLFSDSDTKVIIPSKHEAQFLNSYSNSMLGWQFYSI